MKNRKVNIGRKNPSSAEIANYKDFSALQSHIAATGTSAGASTIPKSGWFAIGTAVVTVAVVVSAFFFGNKKEQQQNEANETTIGLVATDDENRNSPFINPFSDKTTIPYETYTLHANKGKVLTHPTGSEIHIPANAFLDEKGKTVKGEVVIQYREFHNQMDILKSGIPMNYDSIGSTHLQSAGMVEIRAYQNNKALFCNPNSPINIDMTSYQKEDDYNVYFLNEEDKEWQYKGKDEKTLPAPVYEQVDKSTYTSSSSTSTSNTTNEEEVIMEELKTLAVKNVNFTDSIWSVRNKKGQPILGETYYFTVEDVIVWQPEMMALDSITWKYERKIQKGVVGSKFFQDCLSFITKPGDHLYRYWDLVIVTFEPGNDYLTFTFRTEGKKDSQAHLKPIFNKGKAPKTCGELFAEYKFKAENKNKQTAESYKEMKRKYGDKISNSSYVTRSFQIDGFGIWNCDNIIDARTRFKHYTANCNYPNMEGDEAKMIDSYFIERNINSVFAVNDMCHYMPNGNGFLITVFNDGKIGYCALNQNATVNEETKTMECPLTIVNDVVDGLDEVKQKMGVGKIQLPS